MSTKNVRSGIQALDRAVAILKFITDIGHGVSLGNISEFTGLPKSTVHRLLQALKENELIVQNGVNGEYWLGFELARMGQTAMDYMELPKIAHEEMERVAMTCEQTCNLYILSDFERLCISQIQGPSYIRKHSYLGNRVPLYCGSAGKLLLAYQPEEFVKKYFESVPLEQLTENTVVKKDQIMQALEQIRREGYCVTGGERDISSSSIATPIFDFKGEVNACITVSGPISMLTEEYIKKSVPVLMESSRNISRKLGWKMNWSDSPNQQ